MTHWAVHFKNGACTVDTFFLWAYNVNCNISYISEAYFKQNKKKLNCYFPPLFVSPMHCYHTS